jgi:hypothetical protein
LALAVQRGSSRTIWTFTKKDGIFTTPEEAVLHRVEADKAGKAVVFFHDLMHDGEPLKGWVTSKMVVPDRDYV